MSEPRILIVGAGPAGLALGCDLARRGLVPRVVDRAAEPAPESRALGLNARTLEVLDGMGVVGPILDRGKVIDGFTVHGRDASVLGRLPLAVGEAATPYPFEMVLPQSDTVRILLAAFERAGGSVAWRTTFELAEGAGDRPAGHLLGPDGSSEPVEADWLVGADGAHSAVRHGLGVPFAGAEYPEDFLLADVAVAWDLSAEDAHLFLRAEGPVVGFPYPAAGRWRLVDTSGAATTGDPGPTVARFQHLLDAIGVRARVSDPTWTSLFRVHRRLVDSYRPRPRVLLVGDAAHVHSPASGQGLNTGVQDAFNLGWKLALVATGRADPALLDTLTAERRPAAEAVLRDSDRITRAVLARNAAAVWVRDHLLGLLLGIPAVRHAAAAGTAKLGLRYGPGLAVGDDPDRRRFRGGPAPGERAPALEPGSATGPGGRGRLLAHLRDPRFTLLLIPGREGPPREVDLPAETALAPVADLLRLVEMRDEVGPGGHPVQPDPTGALRAAFGVRGEPALYLIRPDGYVALRLSPPRPEPVLAFLGRFATGPRPAGRP